MREENPEHRWRLGVDARTSAAEVQPSRPAVAESLPSRDVSHARLARPVYVVTVEHIAWGAIGVWAALTRLVALGAAPMNPTGAVAALAEFAIAKDGRAALAAIPGHYASWPELLQGAVFGAIGAGDARARIVVAICGLILVKLAFATRGYIGRPGALALGAMLAISPTLTYYSRDGATAVVSMTAMLAAILIAESMRSKPGVIRGAALGVSIALWLSCDATGYASAATVAVAAACVGAFKLATHDHRRLRIRVWWQRRRAVVVVTAIVAIVGWLALTTVWFSYPVADVSAAKWRAAFALPSVAFERGLRNVIPILGFYEFAIMALAIVGAAAIVADKARSRFAAWSIVWAAVSVAMSLTVGANRAEHVLAILIPFAMVAAHGVDALHRSESWKSMRWAIAALAALTIWVQLTTSFVYPAPNTNEAAWDRHALLFWQTPTTSIRTRSEFRRAAAAVASGAGATVSIPDDAPQARWYLREFAAAPSPDTAAIVVTLGSTQAGSAAGDTEPGSFGLEEWWNPNYRRLTIGSAIRYFFTQRAWSDVQIRDARIEVRGASAPTGAE